MDNEAHTEVENPNPSSPKQKDNNCAADVEHVINKKSQLLLDTISTNANILDLTASSCATKLEAIEKCSEQQQKEPHQAQLDSLAQAPVDLTNNNSTEEINCTKKEIQTEPFNLKVDNMTSEPVPVDILDELQMPPKENSDKIEQYNCTNSLANLEGDNLPASIQVEGDQTLESNVDNTADDASNKAINCDKKEEDRLVKHNESILDLRINNSHEEVLTLSPHKTYQGDLTESDFETKPQLEVQENARDLKEKMKNVNNFELAEKAIQINGSHRDSPIENCEYVLENSNAVEEIEQRDKEKVDAENKKPNHISILDTSTTPAENTNKHITDLDLSTRSTNLDNINEQNIEIKSATTKIGETDNELSERRYSSTESLSSTSTLRSSSSHQLIIDQPVEDERVPPLRLKLKRKHRKSSSSVKSVQLTKKASVEEDLYTKETVDNDLNVLPQTTVESLQLTTSKKLLVEEQPKLINTNSEKASGLVESANTKNASAQQTLIPASQYYKCTACGTYHENWSFFLHLQEKHDRFLCLYCVKCFPTAEKLALHLEIKHDLEQNHFNTEEDFRSSALVVRGFALETRFLMCCTCQYIFRENAPFTEHACLEFMKSCMLCGQKGRHTNTCKANPITKRRNKKKIRQKSKPLIAENSIPITEPTQPQYARTQQPLPVSLDHAVPPTLQQQQEQQQPQQEALKTPIRRLGDDSNSSSNMVIDETCNTSHSLPPNLVNPFKALDESERLEQEHAQQTENTLNNVFKLKLRVPKEFQKPVDEAISTSESEHGEEELTDVNSNQNEFNNKQTAEEESQVNVSASAEFSLPLSNTDGLNAQHMDATLQSEEESVDDTMANAHLARILQEIEQTKLDIEKTKETLHQRQQQTVVHMTKSVESTEQATQPMEVQTESSVPTAVGDEHWTPTPTPPASPQAPMSSECNAKSDTEPPNQKPEDQETSTAENAANVDEANAILIPNTTPNDEALTVSAPADHSPLPPPPPDDGIEMANEDCLVVDLQLDRPLDQFETVEFVRICLKAAYPYCLYCNHARRIAVDAESLVLHLIAQHRFMATVDSITAEELQPSTLVAKLKSFLPELKDHFMNSSSYCTIGDGRFTRHFNERIFECFQCRFVTSTHKELYLHNRKMHLRTAILCFMCRCNFYSFSEILCHICPGVPHKVSIFEIKFHCCLCDLTDIPSAFRLMVHLRKRHFACDICLEDCRDQSKLSSHVWKHKLHHLCYRCGIAYRNKMDITKHLFWKHGTESALCKRCLQKRWPHVYHFCVPPAIFSCDICQLCFSKAMYLTVHKRLHQQDFRYACMEANCEEKFISRKLLLKHSKLHESTPTSPCALKNEEKDSIETQQQQQQVDNETSKENDNNDTASAKHEHKVEVKEETIEKLTGETNDSEPKESELNSAAIEPEHNSKTAATTVETSAEQQPHERKHSKKRRKRAKESLEDLNLTAPNLSESGSSSESDSETKSTTTAPAKHEPPLSPISDHGEQRTTSEQPTGGEPASTAGSSESVLDIWKSLLQAQQQQQPQELLSFVDYTDDNYPSPKNVHVCISDHDYCAMFAPRQAVNSNKTTTPPNKRGKRTSSGRAPSLSSSSDDSSDDSGTSTSCSCGSNCSCSNGSSSSSSSGDSSDSSTVSGTKKRLRKKSERSGRHRKSFSSSPLKQQNLNTSGEILNINDANGDHISANAATLADVESQIEAEKAAASAGTGNEVKINLEPSMNESDLETAESETDEEYYDEHPQKLATELLSQKRAQLMARTLLSPSHNFDIVENSRPSTPSLPEDVVYEKRQKKKKIKRERKSTSKAGITVADIEASTANSINELNAYLSSAGAITTATTDSTAQPYTTELHYNQIDGQQTLESIAMNQQQSRVPLAANSSSVANNYLPRKSEGSSCSDADYSLKRSKRQRRPNKFYGYTSDDESMASAAFGQTLMIGMRAYKPLPPPQLVWDKEDLPTPDKSILNVSRKTMRQANSTSNMSGGDEPSAKKKKTSSHRRASGNSSGIKRSQKLPPIPRLKIRSAFINNSVTASDLGLDYSSDDSASGSEIEKKTPTRKRPLPSKHSSSTALAVASYLPRYLPNQMAQQQLQQLSTPPPQQPPPPPTPQTTAFNHRIPPALLPNPDFATLQYFKANNIRYPIRPPAGARAARDGESVYCYCRCPYDEVSEMIACDGDSCLIEWFHFECVGIMLAPQGKWFCAECRPQYSEELYPTTSAAAVGAPTNQS